MGAFSRIGPDARYHSTNVFTLDQMLRATGGRVIHGAPNGDERFVGGAFDSPTPEPGSVFFPLRDRRDGHEVVAAFLPHCGPALPPVRTVPLPSTCTRPVSAC